MKRVALALLFVLSGFAVAQAWSFAPLMEARRHALITFEGVQSRYQVHYFRHEEVPDFCIMLIVDTQTGFFTSTEVPGRMCSGVVVD